ncbi:Molybdopterin or thiamine biosynthesis adenylyltransferase [Paraburkholderia phenazinium]|uniref:Molybdopterin or thiamine biosynthesis adenylyltransferase n=1 Tax=Paraburkholderia phenazinium TaxID=60549 RepID=A0A1G7NUP1_9BURK|nr:ThiF family adenylyltransferase [Paraburkholderia phenazinium]SDF77744.1 Molybdopterin or thiamine biosynthesis adenylyltransferase [Paraburkholderia phenazinium]
MSLLVDQPQRMAREKRLLDALAHEVAWFRMQGWRATTNGELELRFSLTLLHGTFDGVLVYPRYFPDVPAFIRPQRPGESWSGHQYLGSGVLCLERGPDNWDPSVTGVELVRSANKLLWSEVLQVALHRTPPAPSRHHQTLGQALRGESRRFLVTPQFVERLATASGGPAWPMKTATTRRGECELTFVTEVGDDATQRLTGMPVSLGANTGSGWAISMSKTHSSKVTTLDELVDLVSNGGGMIAEVSNKTIAVCDTQHHVRAFFVPPGEPVPVIELAVIDASASEQARLPPAYAKLGALTVTVVGLGSLGSKVAVSLARSGVRRFGLIDADVLLPQNLVRNELDWQGVGFAKVEAVAERIRLVALDANVVALPFEVAGQENPLAVARLAELIGSSDLVIDATANSDAFLMLAAVCQRAQVPLVWGEVFAGGFGALMARSRPGRDADPLGIRTHIFGVMGTMEPVPHAEANRYALNTDDKVLVAGDAEVSYLASAITAFALDAVCSDGESEYPVAAYLLGFKKFWEFKQPFDTIPIQCPGPAGVGAPAPLTDDEVATIGELLNAVNGGAGAAGNGSA